MKTRILCLVLALMLALALFAGCGSSSTDTTSADEPAAAADEPSAPADEPAAPADEPAAPADEPAADDGFSFPLAETKELSYYFLWSQALADIMQDPEDLLYFRSLDEATNVHLNVTPCLVTTAAELYPVMVASGDWCDIVDGVNGMYAGGFAQALSDDFILPLNDLMDYMPNYTALREENPGFEEVLYLEDGTMPSFGMLYNGGYPITYGLVIRTDYLDKVDMEMPQTVEEYHDVLAAFNTELGVSGPLWVSMYGAYQNHAFSSAYGVIALTTANLDPPFHVENGTVTFDPTLPAMKDYLTMMHEWYEEGLIYGDFMTAANNFFPDFSLVGELGVYTIPVGIMNQMSMYSEDPNYEISASYTPVLNKGDTVHLAYNSADYQMTGTCLTTACEDPELAARYIDFWYSEEGFYILNYGVEGETYEMVDGKPEYITENVFSDPSLTTDQSLMLVSKQNGTFVVDYLNRQSVAFNDAQMAAFDIWGVDQDDWNYPTNALMNEQEADIYAANYSEVSTYVTQYIPQAILGEVDIEETWDEFVATCESLGSIEITQVKQSALDRYLSSKGN